MTKSLPYIRDRDGVFQYERRVPQHIQRDAALFADKFGSRPLFRRSLRTKRRAEAAIAYEAVDREFEACMAPPGNTPTIMQVSRSAPSRVLTDADLAAIAERYLRIIAGPFEKLHRRANVDRAAAAELARLESDLEIDGEAIMAALRSHEVDPDAPCLQPHSEAALVIAEHGFAAPEGSEERGALIGAIRSGLEGGYRRIVALSEGDVPPTLGTALVPLKPATRLTLAEAVERYVEVRKPPVKAVSETRLALRQIEQVVGRKALAALSRDDVHKFVEYLSKQKVGGKTEGSVVRHLSEQSISKRLRMLSAAVNFVRDRGLYDGDNMMVGINVSAYIKDTDQAAMPEKRRLTIDEINKVLEHPWFTGCGSPTDTYRPGRHRLTGSRYWVPVVALFTGCRAGELGGLNISEVMLDGSHPHIIIRNNEHRRTKSKRTRRVPIIDALVALGFPAYVERIKAAGHQRVFPDWKASKRKGGGEADFPAWSNSSIIRAFNRQVIPAMLGGELPAAARREVTFHSLRGSFKAMLAASNNVPSAIYDEVVGHAQSDLDRRYIGEVTIEETYPSIRGCTFKGLIVPMLS